MRKPRRWTALLPLAPLVLSATLSVACATSRGDSRTVILRESEVVYRIVRVGDMFVALDARGDSIPLGRDVASLETWYIISPGTLSMLYRKAQLGNTNGP